VSGIRVNGILLHSGDMTKVCGELPDIPFSVRVSGGDPNSQFFVISQPQPGEDHYVQARILDGSYSNGISLGEKGEYFDEPEIVSVYEARDPAATAISAASGPPGERDPIPGFGALQPPPVQIARIGVLRRPAVECP
jgi:hypothetical protein